MSIPQFKQIAPNFHAVTVGTMSVWFSYETPVAFQIEGHPVLATENEYSASTGKHLNLVDPDQSHRVPLAEFRDALALYAR
jgi:hypothetical protein